MRTCFAPAILSLLLPAPVAAHPLTDFRFDRQVAVRLADDAVEVLYTLEVSPMGLHLDARNRLSVDDIAGLDKTAIGYAKVYAARVAPELLEKLHITVDGARLSLSVQSIDVTYTDHAACRFKLRSSWPPGKT